MSGGKSSTATATTAIADSGYVGRFAPSPTGDMHLGSLLTAAASFLDARSRRGRWLVRIEDLDKPREVPGAADRILRCLEEFGMHWDGEVLRQSRRVALYEDALNRLRNQGRLFRCACSRQQLLHSLVYPGTCRHSPPSPDQHASIRFTVAQERMVFDDRVQGRVEQDPAAAPGDFIVWRRDGTPAYMLAVVVDDAAQGVTDVVRGADLLDSTAAQIQLQQALGLARPRYAHVPVLMEAGAKLAKSRRSVAVGGGAAARQLLLVLGLLGQDPPAALSQASIAQCWEWAIEHWRIEQITQKLQITV